MPERRTRLAGALAAGLVAATAAAAPAVLAQTEPGVSDPAAWSESHFIRPFDGGEATVAVESFDIAGLFVKQRQSTEQIVRVDVSFEDTAGGDTVDTTPEEPSGDPADDGEQALTRCVPENPPPFVGEGTTDDRTASYSFTVPAEQSIWPCNGRYRVVAAAQSNQEVEPYELIGVLTVVVPPLPVTAVSARYDDGIDAVEISFEPLSDDEQAVDAIGYRVERAGPATDGDHGSFQAVGEDLANDDEPVALDEPEEGGDYRYRVRAMRSGPDGPVLSDPGGTAVAEVTVPGAPPDDSTTTTSATGGTSRTRVNGRSGIGAPRPRQGPRFGTPTTADTGFEETLDYGDREEGGDAPELAGEAGRSIIRTEDEGAGLLAPVAGALVLVGWAGHIAYLNRLAKQF